MTWCERDLDTGPRGLTLRISEWGQPDGRPLVILHGYLEQGPAWDRVAQQLDRWVIAPDHRGHGCSQHVGAGGFYHFWDYVSDLDALVRTLPSPIDLVGHSMGGTVATLFAATRPDAVRRLVLVEGLGPPEETDPPTRARRFLRDMESPLPHPSFASVEEAAQRMRTFNPKIDPAHALKLAARQLRPVTPADHLQSKRSDGALTWSWDPLHRARAPFAFQSRLHRIFLTQITAPTLVIYGGASPYENMVPDLTRRERSLENSERLVMPGIGHHPHHEDPDGLARVITAHLGM